jgi:hypothetical protein
VLDRRPWYHARTVLVTVVLFAAEWAVFVMVQVGPVTTMDRDEDIRLAMTNQR